MDYTFQHRYRSKSISYFFQKELFFSLVTCFIGLAIYLDFIQSFRGPDVYFQKAKNYTMSFETCPLNPVTGQNDLSSPCDDPRYRMWLVCNEEDLKCFGNGVYTFDQLAVRPSYELEMYSDGFRNETSNQTFIFEERLDKFISGWTFWQYGISGTLILSFIQRQIFNVMKKKEVNVLVLDIFLQVDIMTAISSGLLFYLLSFTNT